MKTLKNYSSEEKIKAGRWIQRHSDTGLWHIHYIQYDTEYRGEAVGKTKKQALANTSFA